MSEMSPRERLLCALNHQEPDRVPMDLGSTTFTGIHARAYEKLKARLGISAVGEHVVAYSQVAVPDEAVLQRLGVDIRGVFPGTPDHYRQSGSSWSDESGDMFRDEWGVVRRRPKGGYYYDLHSTPFGHLDLPGPALLNDFPWPDPEDPGRYRGLRERVRSLRKDVDYAVVGHLGADVFLRAIYLRGFENFLTDLVINKSFAAALCERITDYWERMAGRFLDEIGDEIDVITMLDDIADQNGPIMSPAAYREIIKPMHARLIGSIRARTKARILFHCCGSLVDFMPDFVDLGVDALTPVQVSARGMDMAWLKKEYGDRIAFWGGIDSHRVLPHGTPGEVRAEVELRLGQMARQGGYVLCAVHNIQPDVPPENVISLYEAGSERGRYPLRRD